MHDPGIAGRIHGQFYHGFVGLLMLKRSQCAALQLGIRNHQWRVRCACEPVHPLPAFGPIRTQSNGDDDFLHEDLAVSPWV